jgi:hypothetical protein
MSFDHTILKGTTSKIIEVMIRDSTDGNGKSGITTSDLIASYVREGGTRTAITLASGTAGDAYSSGKWCEVDSSNAIGLYQLHIPDAALASGADAVTITLQQYPIISSTFIDKTIRISLLNVDLRDGADAGLVSLASVLVHTATNIPNSISSLNDIAATDIVSGGAITTSGGAVSNVTLVDTTTTNTDMVSVAGLSTFDHTTDQVVASNMRGTDGANTVAPDNASIAAILTDTGTTIPASISALNDLSQSDVRTAVGLASANLDAQLGDIPTVSEFNARTLVAAAYFDPTTDVVIVGTNNDKTDYALSAASREAIGDDFLSHVITKGSAGTIERAFWQSLKASQLADGEVSGTPTASAFDTNLTAVTGAYDHLLILFTSGSLAGEARPISSYNSTNGRITLQEPLTAAPSSADEFIVVPDHSHPVSEIVEAVFNEPQSSYTTAGTFGYYIDAQVSSAGGGATASEIADAVWDETRAGHTTAGTFGYYLDDRVSQVGGGGGASAADIWGALLSDYAVSGTFGARFQEADRYTNTTAQIRYVTQGDAYDDTANNAIEWSVAKDYSGASSITLTIEHRVTGATLLTHTVTYIDASTLKAYLSSSDTAFSQLTTDADFGVHPYTVVASYSGELETIVNGAISIKQG